MLQQTITNTLETTENLKKKKKGKSHRRNTSSKKKNSMEMKELKKKYARFKNSQVGSLTEEKDISEERL